MKKAYRNLVAYALANNCTVSVWDGEEFQVKKCTSFKRIVEAIESVEEANLKIRYNGDEVVGFALVSAYGLAPDETVIDFSDNDWMKGWEQQYCSECLL